LLTKLLPLVALGFAIGLVSCGSQDDSSLLTGADDTGGSNEIAGSSVGGNSGGNAAGDANGMGVSTGGTKATGTGGAGNSGMGGAHNGGAGSGGAAMGGSAGSTGTGGAGGGASNPCMASAPPMGGMQTCSSNKSGDLGGGYAYTIWSSGSGGCITPYGVGAAFKANWNNAGDFLARVGINLGSNKTPDQIGTFSADYAETKTGDGGGASFIGIYGWSVNDLHEYYIVDDWFGSRPQWGEKVGTVTVDGGTYDILTHTQVNQPSIMGNATFVQFWSMRQTPRQCGHISISEHFKAWAKQGMNLGQMYECKLVVEVVGGNGSIDFTTGTVVAK
jgi:hypothetical protein